MKRSVSLFTVLVLMSILLSGCYFFREVQTSEVGLQLDDGVSVSKIVGSGRYNDAWSWYSDLVVIDVSNKTEIWEDTSMVTSDKQPISLKIALTYSRCRDSENIQGMFNDYRMEAFDDAALQRLVFSRVPSPAKVVTTKYSLDEMLGIAEGLEQVGGRQVVENDLATLLKPELAEIHVCLQNVTIADIGVDQSYLDALSQKAQANIQREVAQAQTATLAETLKQEQAQTNIDLEIARRDNLVNEELAKVYQLSPEFLEIRKLELMAEIFDQGDLVVYVPAGTELSSVLLNNTGGGVVPVPGN